MAEQSNELLMKNHESQPIGATPFPGENVVFSKNYGRGRGCDHDRGRSNYISMVLMTIGLVIVVHPSI